MNAVEKLLEVAETRILMQRKVTVASRMYAMLGTQDARERCELAQRRLSQLDEVVNELLENLVAHQQDWCHLSTECRICRGELTMPRFTPGESAHSMNGRK
jgi:hypothetical protein